MHHHHHNNHNNDDLEAGRSSSESHHDHQHHHRHHLARTVSDAIDHADRDDARRGVEDEEARDPENFGEKNPATGPGAGEGGGAGGAGGSSSDDDDKTLVAWDEHDADNPHNWSFTKKTSILVTMMMLVLNSTIGSALPSNAIPSIMEEYHITSEQQHVLPISVFLIGYVFGPTLWGPLSEQFGRRVISLCSFAGFAIWTMACALTPNFAALNVFRLICGVFASAAIAVVPGVVADMNGDHRSRGRAMAYFMVTTTFGPILAPIISGFCSSTIGWRWAFWIALIYGGMSFILLLFVPETFAPVLLVKRARKLRAADPVRNADIVAPRELENTSLLQLFTVVLTRPLRMIMSELIVSCVCAYLALIYAIFYMSFQAFPIIFGDLYGLSPGVTGLCFLPIGGGAILSLPVFLAWEPALAWARRHPRLARHANQEEYRRLPIAILGGPLFVVSLFWLGWSARRDVSFAVPMLAGIPFGMGFMFIFMALLNYLTDAYEIFAASANAASSMSRSLLAVVLPLATTPMFDRLGIAGACSLLGGLTAVMCVIPFLFIWKGERIRAGSRFCTALREQKEEAARKAELRRVRRQERAEMAAAAAAASGREESCRSSSEDEQTMEQGRDGSGHQRSK